MFVLSAIGGFILQFFLPSSSGSLVNAIFAISAGGYFIYNSVNNMRILHVIVGIFSYYFMLVFAIYFILLLTHGG